VGSFHLSKKGKELNDQLSSCIIGDVNIDYIADLSHVTIRGESNACFQNRITSSVGGNAVFFAEAAHEAKYSNVTVLCSIGDDVAGKQAREHLQKFGVVVHTVPSHLQTGQVIIIYQPNDNRIMIADRGANTDFRVPETVLLREIADKSDMLYVSGYMLLDNSQCTAIHKISSVFREANAKVLIDMVPHEVWRTRTWREYVELCSCADCVAVEMSTVSSFHTGVPDALQPQEAAQILLKDFEFCLVRINDKSDLIICDRMQQRIFSVPYRRTLASLRFTDRIIAHVMQQYIANPIMLFESNLWLEDAIRAVNGSS
jgi:sugar/nucleoside kinase (ribokinase family)